MKSIFRPVTKPHRRHHHHQNHRSFFDATTTNTKWVRDRGLDHAVEKEKNLKPLLNLKNLIKSEPSKSLPISIIAENKETLNIPTRPIDFVRKYPSIFQEFLPGGIGIHPHIRLTPEALGLDADEQLIYQSDSYRQAAADRLLKLLMISRINKIPLNIIDRFKFDLGLPQDYVQTLVPEFPDYFQVIGKNGGVLELELVCWSNELAVSVIEKKAAMNREIGYEKGMPIAFPLQYSRGFEMDKKFRNWVDKWQKLPYISPYENGSHLLPKSDESDKWAVAVLHELLHILVPKKTEKDNILWLGEYLGVRSRFKRALLQHLGIFYISSKIRTHTVVLREGYKRDLLIERHPVMGMRSRYIHLMNAEKVDNKPKSASGSNAQQQRTTRDSKEGEGEEDDEGGEEQDGELYGSSGSEVEDDDNEDDDEEDEDDSWTGASKNVAVNKGRTTRKTYVEVKGPLRTPVGERSVKRYPSKTKGKNPPQVPGRTEMRTEHNARGRSPKRSDFSRSRGRSLPDRRTST